MSKQKNSAADTNQIDSVSKPAPGLYVIATPIGNLKDITLRALELLSSVDTIVCEDTRVTGKLLAHYGIKNKLSKYNDHSTASVREGVIYKIECGESVALVSDAGTPLISDPGYKLVNELQQRDLSVYAVPGPSAFVSALAISGMPTDKFMFGGFLANKSGARSKQIEVVKDFDGTIAFYETAKRMKATMRDLESVLGGKREVVICREITKRFEEVIKGSVEQVSEEVVNRDLKGEIVLLISPCEEYEISSEKLDNIIRKYLYNSSVKSISNSIHEDIGGAKKRIYERVVELKNEQKEEG